MDQYRDGPVIGQRKTFVVTGFLFLLLEIALVSLVGSL